MRTTAIRPRRTFTLVEMLTVLAIIAVIAAMLLPAVQKSRSRAKFTKWQAAAAAMRNDPTLLACYDFSEGEGDTLKNSAAGDQSNTAYVQDNFDGVISGATWLVNSEDCRFIQKPTLSFDGTNDYVALKAFMASKFAQFPVPSQISVCAWVRSSANQRQIIVSYDRSETWRLSLRDDNGNGQVAFDTSSTVGGTHDMGPSTSYTDGKWHFVVGTYDSDGEAPRKRLYVDGEMVASADDPHSGMALWAGSQPRRYGFIGVGSEAAHYSADTPDTGPDLWFRGQIDEIAIFQRALSEQEIQEMYRVGQP